MSVTFVDFLAAWLRLKKMVDLWIIFAAAVLTVYIIRWCYYRLTQNHPADKAQHENSSRTDPSQENPSPRGFNYGELFTSTGGTRHNRSATENIISSLPSSSRDNKPMRYPRHVRVAKKKKALASLEAGVSKTKQPYDAFLVLDVEATCHQGTDFNYPNEIIEFPICLMRWKDKEDNGTASKLEIVDEFRTYVRPTWRPILSQFCVELTGITQEQVDSAPPFVEVLENVQNFLVKNGLIDAKTGQSTARFCWCSDGPFDIRDFVVKQCFLSKVPMPSWIQGDVLDVRRSVADLRSMQPCFNKQLPFGRTHIDFRWPPLNIPAQLEALELPGFQGRQHSGIDDTRNITRIVSELARRGVCLLPNTTINSYRRWPWMGKYGQVLVQFV